jgi:hypothetical protein
MRCPLAVQKMVSDFGFIGQPKFCSDTSVRKKMWFQHLAESLIIFAFS